MTKCWHSCVQSERKDVLTYSSLSGRLSPLNLKEILFLQIITVNIKTQFLFLYSPAGSALLWSKWTVLTSFMWKCTFILILETTQTERKSVVVRTLVDKYFPNGLWIGTPYLNCCKRHKLVKDVLFIYYNVNLFDCCINFGINNYTPE